MEYIDTHLSNIHNQTEFDQKEIGNGDIVKFLYKGTTRYAMVLNTADSKGLMHTVVLEKLSPQMLYKFKLMMGINVDVDAQTFYKTYISRDISFKNSDCYRTFDKTQVNQISVLDYKFGDANRDKLIPYGEMRDLTESEYAAAAYDYFSNATIRIGRFPGLANTAKEFIASLKEAGIQQLDQNHLAHLENSAAPAVLLAPDPLRTAMNWAIRNRDYDYGGETMGRVKDLRIAMSNGVPMPPAIVISYDPDNRFLLSGDVRLCIGIAKGFSLGVKVLRYEIQKTEAKETKGLEPVVRDGQIYIR